MITQASSPKVIVNITQFKHSNSKTYNSGAEYDLDVSGIEALGAITVKSLIMKECALGPRAITALATALSTESTAVGE